MNGRSAQKSVAIAAILILCLFFASIASAAQNLIDNPGFELNNTSGWYAMGSCNISASSGATRTGSYSGLASGRAADWTGFAQSLMGKLQAGKTYNVSAFMLLNAGGGAESAQIKMTIKKSYNTGNPSYVQVATANGTTEWWVQLSNTYTHSVDAGRTLTNLEIYFETPGSTLNYYLDDVSMSDASPSGLDRIVIAGPTEVNEYSDNVQYSCTAIYSDGSSAVVTNSSFWNVSSASATITNSGNRGLLTTYGVDSDQPCTITAYYQGYTDTHDIIIKAVPLAVVAIKISGPDVVGESSGSQYMCTAYLNDRSSAEITSEVSWSVNPDTYATIDAGGYLTTQPVTSNQTCTITAIYEEFSDNFAVTIREESQPPDWRELANERIEEIRKRDAQITVLDLSGKPVPDAGVQIRQKRHRFAFGSAINNAYVAGVKNMSNPDYTNFFKNHFEWAVCENESKWYANEPSQGNVTYTDADIIYNWCKANGIPMRGHCLFWEVENIQKNYQTWVWNLAYAPLPAESPLRTAVQSRLNSAMNHFKGKFLHWDIDNEMLSGYFFRGRLGESIVPWMFRTARQIDPACKLFVNEYSGNSFGWNDGWMYADFVEELRNTGAPIHGVGLQGHVAGNFNPELYLSNVLDPLETTELPLWITEFDSENADVARRANDLENFYRLAFSHPAVEGILMWGFWQSSHWRPDWWIVNADWTLNAAGVRYEALMREWTTNDTLQTDSEGFVDFRGFHGSYEITFSFPGEANEIHTIELEPGDDTQEFVLQTNFEPGVPKTCPAVVTLGLSIESDLNHDCYVNYSDLAILADYWLDGDCAASGDCEGADFEPKNGSVDFSDMAGFAKKWMTCNDPLDSGCTPNW